jgi:hypothetical protein
MNITVLSAFACAGEDYDTAASLLEKAVEIQDSFTYMEVTQKYTPKINYFTPKLSQLNPKMYPKINYFTPKLSQLNPKMYPSRKTTISHCDSALAQYLRNNASKGGNRTTAPDQMTYTAKTYLHIPITSGRCWVTLTILSPPSPLSIYHHYLCHSL